MDTKLKVLLGVVLVYAIMVGSALARSGNVLK